MPYTGQTIAELDETKPSGTTEYVNTGDDAIREIKSVLKKQYAVTTKTAAYTTTVSDSTILCDATAAAFTVTVVSAVTAGAGKRQKFKKTDASANAVTISYGSSTVLTRQNDVLELISDGTNWVVISVVNADKVDGYDAGNASGNIPVSNGTVNTNLNSDMIDGYHASPTPGANTIPVGDANGRIAWGAKPAFRGALVKRTAMLNVANATPTIVPFDAEVYDTDNIHDNVTSNSRLTVPAGVTKVRLSANSDWTSSSSGARQIWINKNGLAFDGAPYVIQPASTASRQNIISPVINVVGGDYFEFLVYQDSTTPLDLGGNSLSYVWFAMEIVE